MIRRFLGMAALMLFCVFFVDAGAMDFQVVNGQVPGKSYNNGDGRIRGRPLPMKRSLKHVKFRSCKNTAAKSKPAAGKIVKTASANKTAVSTNKTTKSVNTTAKSTKKHTSNKAPAKKSATKHSASKGKGSRR